MAIVALSPLLWSSQNTPTTSQMAASISEEVGAQMELISEHRQIVPIYQDVRSHGCML